MRLKVQCGNKPIHVLITWHRHHNMYACSSVLYNHLQSNLTPILPMIPHMLMLLITPPIFPASTSTTGTRPTASFLQVAVSIEFSAIVPC